MGYTNNISEYGAGQTPLWDAPHRDDDIVDDWLRQGETGDVKTESISFSELVEIAEQGDEFAMFDVAFVYAVGGDGVEKNPGKAFYWMRRAAELGAEEAQYCLGRFYLVGFGVPRSTASARHWFTLAAENGHMKALLQLKEMREHGS